MPKLLFALVFALLLQVGVAHAGALDDILAAAENNRTEAVLELLQLGLDVNTSTADGTTLLMTAARNGNLALVDALLKGRANHLNQNKFGDNALMLAVIDGKLDVVRRLADLPGPQENRDGWTPLHYAAFGGHVEIARYLMSKGAKVDFRAPNSQTALMLAAAGGHMEMVRFLIDEQADLRLRDRDGKTAREIAVAKGNQHVADYISLFDPKDHQ